MDKHNKKRIMSTACRYAACRFALNYCMYGDTFFSRNEEAGSLDAFQERFHPLVGALLSDHTAALEEVDALRREIICDTEVIFAFLSCLQIYEYVLNRLEGRFQESAVDGSEEQIVDEIMRYIVSGEDTAAQNQRIKAVLGQLPMRFTKAKFSSLILQSLSVYEGTGRQSLEQLIPMLRTEAMLDLPEDMQGRQPKLWAMMEKLRRADYAHLTKERFDALQECMCQAEETLSALSSDSMMMIDLVNDLYVIGLTRKDALMDSREEELICEIIGLVYRSIDKKEPVSQRELEEKLVQMEGRQEHYYAQWSRFDLSGLDHADAVETGREECEILRRLDMLLSTSSFMSLEEETEAGTEHGEDILLSRKAVEEMCAPFLSELEESWKNMPRPVVRAVMARLLTVLPQFFRTSDEVREFIGGCLSACTDPSEKAISIELIRKMMESEDAFI